MNVAKVVALALATLALPSAAQARDPAIMAAGDIACRPGWRATSGACRQRATARIIRNRRSARILTLGDNQYERGTLAEFRNSYRHTWGRFKKKTRPSVGNHEYYGNDLAKGYFDYFRWRAGPRWKGYYSYNVGRWHLIALNTHINMRRDSTQVAWLRRDLAANPARCTLAYWHLPRFSSGDHGNYRATAPFWEALYAAGADVILSGHDHDYERFAPQTPAGVLDHRAGIRQFVVGTGGRSLRPFNVIQPNSKARNAKTFGVLRLRLHRGSYHWRFVPIAGRNYSDSGFTRCHGAPDGPAGAPATSSDTHAPVR